MLTQDEFNKKQVAIFNIVKGLTFVETITVLESAKQFFTAYYIREFIAKDKKHKTTNRKESHTSKKRKPIKQQINRLKKS